jgi:ribosomal silencing factor RsfS
MLHLLFFFSPPSLKKKKEEEKKANDIKVLKLILTIKTTQRFIFVSVPKMSNIFFFISSTKDEKKDIFFSLQTANL